MNYMCALTYTWNEVLLHEMLTLVDLNKVGKHKNVALKKAVMSTASIEVHITITPNLIIFVKLTILSKLKYNF